MGKGDRIERPGRLVQPPPGGLGKPADRLGADLLAAFVSRVSEEQKKPLYWLTRDFTAIGGHHWYGVVSGSDRCPRDRAAELAVRLAALAREVIVGASVRP